MACCTTEWTAATEPLRYSSSSVIAMWTSEGSQTLPVALPQSAALRNAGARRKARPLAPPAIWPGKRTWLSNCDDLMASAGGKDCSDGDSTTITMAAEKNPDTRAAHSIALTLPQRCHRFLPPPPRLGFVHPKTPCRRAMASSNGSAAARLYPHSQQETDREHGGRSSGGGLPSPQLHRLALPGLVDRRVEWGRSEGESMRREGAR
uniref:Uncharacterized protein n=1 Tax=Oryza brachyantha TaxID=4533 RepID=J3LMY7_ORYBR